ncbi:MAG: ABC transporter ATP-binding protein [Ardenticatenaceae bacterium]|nr:ABC transporter ATP-binding protein [Ardenticatenaceae bacterium]
MTHLLEVKNLVTKFYTEEGIVNAVNGISYTLDEGESMALVGESGCGKSVSVLSLLGLIPMPPGRVEGGEVWYNGRNLLKISAEEMRHIRGREISMIFQDPVTCLNPVLTIGFQLMEGLKLHLHMNNHEAKKRAVELLNLVGLPDAENRLSDYPHQFSGGQRQRIMIAMALSCNPAILIADEPTTALDVTIQAQIVELVKQLQQKLGMAIIWITHDMGVVAGLVQKVAVMYAGYIVEMAEVSSLYTRTTHPYTKALLQSIPTVDARQKRRLASIEGLPPDLRQEFTHCPFAPRCPYAMEKCLTAVPPLFRVGTKHTTACWLRENGRAAKAWPELAVAA